jgi:hypothetical protein
VMSRILPAPPCILQHNALPRLLVGLAKLEYPDRGVYERGAASLAQRQGDISDVALAHIAIAARTLAKTSVRVDPLLDLLADLVDKRPGALLPQVGSRGEGMWHACSRGGWRHADEFTRVASWFGGTVSLLTQWASGDLFMCLNPSDPG